MDYLQWQNRLGYREKSQGPEPYPKKQVLEPEPFEYKEPKPYRNPYLN